MYISEVTIHNYRNFSEFHTSLNEGISIIIGENNVGKSNFLEALSLIFNSNYSLRRRVLNQEDFWNGLVISNKWPEISIEVKIEGINSDDELAITSRWLTTNPGEAKLTYKFRPKSNLSTAAPTTPTPIQKLKLPLQEYEWVLYGGEKETLDTFDFPMLSRFIVEYVGALRDATTELKKTSGHLHQILKTYDVSESDLENISEQIRILNDQIEQGKEIQNAQKAINHYLELITGAFKQQVKIRMGESNYDSILKDLKLLIGSDKDHSVEMNGLGYNNLLYISLLLTQHTNAKEKKLQKKDYLFPLLMVEEPEAHLHSNLQKYLANYFINQKIIGQLLITSHSSHVSSHGELDHLVLFYHHLNRVEAVRIGTLFNEGKKEEREYKRYLERWLDATKSNIFFGRKVLLVEGIAERLLIPKFFQLVYPGKTLEGEGISIISVDGVAFRPFLHLFGPSSLNLKCAVLTDSDPDKQPLLLDNNEVAKDTKGNVIKIPVYPIEANDREICARTKGLINDYENIKNVGIYYNLKTFEYDLILEKNISFFKKLIEKYKIGTKEFREQIKDVTEESEFAKRAYETISEEKGEFSQWILDELNNGEKLNIPSYIKQAFEFLIQGEK